MDEHANDPESGDAWCSEYEDALDTLFGWTSDRSRTVEYEVTVRLTREVEANEIVNADSAFGGYHDDAEVDDDWVTVYGTVRINVEGDSDGPDRDEVENVLDNHGYKYDSFDITSHETVD